IKETTSIVAVVGVRPHIRCKQRSLASRQDLWRNLEEFSRRDFSKRGGLAAAGGNSDQEPTSDSTTMSFSLHEAPPNAPLRSISGTAAPPSTDILYNFPLAANPNQWPSGEKNGPSALAVPGSCAALGWSSLRVKSTCCPPEAGLAMYAIRVPSGEITTLLTKETVGGKEMSTPRSTS